MIKSSRRILLVLLVLILGLDYEVNASEVESASRIKSEASSSVSEVRNDEEQPSDLEASSVQSEENSTESEKVENLEKTTEVTKSETTLKSDKVSTEQVVTEKEVKSSEWKITHYNNGNVKTKTYYENGKKIQSLNYLSNGKLDTMYTYQSNKIYTKYYYNNNGFQYRSYRYDTHGNKQAAYDYVHVNGERIVKKKWTYNGSGHKTSYAEYHNNGRLSVKESYKNGKKDLMYTFQTNGKVYTKYYYKNNQQVRSYRYDSQGYKQNAYDYKTINNKRIIVKKWTYTRSGNKEKYESYNNNAKLVNSQTYYSNGKVKYQLINHYQKNNVRTGSTQTWYMSNGKIKKIDATTYPTYYSQYTRKYKKYSCPQYNGDLYKHGCIVNAMSMFYSIYFNDELTPIEIYNQGYHCFFNVESAYARNGLSVKKDQVRGNKRSAYTSFENRNHIVPNGKSTFTIREAIVDYGMPVQLMMRSDGHIRNNFPGHSVLAYRYVYEDGKTHIYAKDPGAKGPTIELQNYMNGKYHEFGASWYQIENAWVGRVQ